MCTHFHFLVVKDPPFLVAESGYGSFTLPIEVYFRNEDEPKKVRFEYYLLLPNLNDPPINQIRSEFLTFQNPSKKFQQKFLKAGGSTKGEILEERKCEKMKKKVGVSSSNSGDSDMSNNSESGMDETPAKMGNTISPNTWDSGDLIKLKKQINSLQDLQQMREMVNIIVQTALYTLNGSTFDFDLCKLDDTTLTKLVKCIKPTC